MYATGLRSAEKHYWDASTARVGALSTVVVPDIGSDTDPLVLSVSGKASIINYVFRLEGGPSLNDANINGLVVSGLRRAIVGGIGIGMSARYTAAAPLVSGYSDNHYRHLFNIGGVVAVIHGDKIWVGNTNGASTNCAEGWLLSGDNVTGPLWPVDTTASLNLTVSSEGKIGSLLIDGKVPPFVPSSVPTVPVTPGCQPLNIPAGTTMFFGASGNDQYNDNFAGSIFSVGFT
jgi:hypothetical protein